MGFPETRLTLIERLATSGSEEDWRAFLQDYWGPVCRFALHWGARGLDDAEDVASQTFEALWESRLLVRWASARRAKLRTLICCVTRNVLSNRNRVQANRDQLLRQWAAELDDSEQARDDPSDAFYAAWVEDVLRQAVESMVAEYYRVNKGDYVRVFYGRLCQRRPVAELVAALQIQPDDVVNYFRHARQHLSEKLRQVIARQVHRYCGPEDWDAESAAEWQQLAAHLSATGGLEEAVRRAYETLNPIEAAGGQRPGLTRALERLTSSGLPSPVSGRGAGGDGSQP